MSNYYKTQMIVFDIVDKRIETTLRNGSSLDIDNLILDLTRIYPVSPKAIEKRVFLFATVNKEKVEIVNREVRLI